MSGQVERPSRHRARHDGKVDEVMVVRSLRADLDAKAVAAAKKWRFKPGTRHGTPVPVVVTIQMTFTME